MIANLYRCGSMLFLVCFMPCATAGGTLQHDPFIRPQLSAAGHGKTGATGTAAAEEIPWQPRLTAVLVAGKNSLVNLQGEIIGLGEEKDGYRLIEVRDQQAVFRKGKKRVVLNMGMTTVGPNKEQESR